MGKTSTRTFFRFSISHLIAISIIAFVIVAAAVLGIALILGGSGSSTQTSSTTSTTQGIDGVVTGYVTVGPSQPVCLQNQSCTVDITGYALNFAFMCPSSSSCKSQNYSATIGPNGHYSALLPGGNYSITGLSPSCRWVGCSNTFPKNIEVEAGMQQVVDLNIDTGIR